MIKEIKRTSQFKKDYKNAIKSGCKEEDFREVLKYLVEQKPHILFFKTSLTFFSYSAIMRMQRAVCGCTQN